MTTPRQLTPDDILPIDEYAKIRKQKRLEMIDVKRDRRIDVGPFATFYFESFDTMWYQVHEMLLVEKGGEEQLADELEAYNPLIPQGNELIATLMFEIDEPERRERVLGELGGVEGSIRLRVGSDEIAAIPEHDVERTNAAGKASSVHFLHFPFSPEQSVAFQDPAIEAILAITQDRYQHMAVIPASTRSALSADLES